MDTKINEINIRRVLRQVWYNDGISRVDIARELNLGKSTVTKIVSSLLDKGIIRIDREGKSGPAGGRKPINLKMNSEYGYILGIEMQTDTFTAMAIDLSGGIIFSVTEPVPMRAEHVVSSFRHVLRLLQPRLRRIRSPLIGIGVGLAGLVNPFNGVILQSNPLAIAEPIEFYRSLKGVVDVPVLIENDANCCCWGELAFKKNERHRDFIFVLGEFRRGQTLSADYWGPAIGFGIVLNQHVHYGTRFSAGEYQSILWKNGNKSQLSITNEQARHIKDDRTIRRKVIREIASHVAFLVNMLNLTSVVFGGELAAYKDEILPIMEAEIPRNWSYDTPVECSIEFASLEERTVAYGAAVMFMERLFAMPDVIESLEFKVPISIDAVYNAEARPNPIRV
jgi:predicted NBD/HSP70 family sugar kinase